MEGKSTFFVLLMVIVVLTISLAALSGFILFNNNTSKSDAGNNEVIMQPSDSELAQIELFKERIFNLMPDENSTSPIVRMSMSIKHFNKVRGLKNVEDKLNSNLSNLRELVGLYFGSITLADFKSTENLAKMKEDIKKSMNELLTSNEKYKDDIVYQVIFEEWFYQ